MNDGKICVSVCAETADELIEQIKRAEELADVIEIRFDCLREDEIDSALTNLPTIDNLLATFRTKTQGGKRELTLQDRLTFWQKFSIHNKNRTFYADFEADTSFFRSLVKSKVIWSQHFFNKIPKNLADIYASISKIRQSDIVKIAVQANDITDAISVWKLLARAKSDNVKIIPIAMGESGKWTRILGLAHGASMTYAALDAEHATAPGQISARDLIEVYRVKELNEATEIYGIVGGDTGVSMSPYMHNTAFQFHNLNHVFVPLQVHDLDEFIRRMVKTETREIELNFKGFAVTIPHKQRIIKHLDSIDETAKKIGAVNTVKIADGKLHGYNTDADGFIEPLLNSYGGLKNARVAVLGAGGAARACVYALRKHEARPTIFARDLSKAEQLADDFQIECRKLSDAPFDDFDVLVNATPLGMKGKFADETPAVAAQIKNLHLIYDLVYNPFETALMREADRANVPKIGGLAMLVAQAIRQQKIWTGKDAPMREMSRAVLQRLR